MTNDLRTATKTIARAIADSVCHTRIVHLEICEMEREALARACEDAVRTGSKSVEWWGTTKTGGEWRIHTTGAV